MFWHRIATMMGCSKAEAKTRMPAAEVHDWVEFWQHEPPGPQSVNHQFAAFASIACNLLRCLSNAQAGTKIRTRFTADDFTHAKKYRKYPTPEELKTKLHIWAAHANASHKQRVGK